MAMRSRRAQGKAFGAGPVETPTQSRLPSYFTGVPGLPIAPNWDGRVPADLPYLAVYTHYFLLPCPCRCRPARPWRPSPVFSSNHHHRCPLPDDQHKHLISMRDIPFGPSYCRSLGTVYRVGRFPAGLFCNNTSEALMCQ